MRVQLCYARLNRNIFVLYHFLDNTITSNAAFFNVKWTCRFGCCIFTGFSNLDITCVYYFLIDILTIPTPGCSWSCESRFLFVKIVKLKYKVREIVKTMSFVIRGKRKNHVWNRENLFFSSWIREFWDLRDSWNVISTPYLNPAEKRPIF